MIARLGAAGKTSPEYIAEVLGQAGMRVIWTTESDTEDKYEEEFHDLLHFSDLEEAEICVMRLDELLRKFRAEGEKAAAERVLDVARLGRRRAEMISRNPRVDLLKRAEKEEIMQWFKVWLETPDAFFEWLEARKASPDFQRRFAKSSSADAVARDGEPSIRIGSGAARSRGRRQGGGTRPRGDREPRTGARRGCGASMGRHSRRAAGNPT